MEFDRNMNFLPVALSLIKAEKLMKCLKDFCTLGQSFYKNKYQKCFLQPAETLLIETGRAFVLLWNAAS